MVCNPLLWPSGLMCSPQERKIVCSNPVYMYMYTELTDARSFKVLTEECNKYFCDKTTLENTPPHKTFRHGRFHLATPEPDSEDLWRTDFLSNLLSLLFDHIFPTLRSYIQLNYSKEAMDLIVELHGKLVTPKRKRRCEVELKFTVHYSLFGPNSEL